jgi:hypothetical protein
MQPAFSTSSAPPPVLPTGQLNGNLHQGVRRTNPALSSGFEAGKSLQWHRDSRTLAPGTYRMSWSCDFGACGPGPMDITPSQQQAVAAAARSWIGTPYLLGGCSRLGADCSGSIIAIYAMAGIKLPGRFTSSSFKNSPLFQRVNGNPELGDVGYYSYGHVVLFGGAAVGGICGGVPCNVWSATHTGGNPFEPANSAWFGTPVWYRYVGP